MNPWDEGARNARWFLLGATLTGIVIVVLIAAGVRW